MKALVCSTLGATEDLTLEERPDLTPGKGEILIDVKASGVNFPDILTVQGKYQFKPPLPFVPGTEVSGIVTQIGEGVTRHAVGDKVIGTLPIGAFAEQCVTSEYTVEPDESWLSRSRSAKISFSSSVNSSDGV